MRRSDCQRAIAEVERLNASIQAATHRKWKCGEAIVVVHCHNGNMFFEMFNTSDANAHELLALAGYRQAYELWMANELDALPPSNAPTDPDKWSEPYDAAEIADKIPDGED